MKIVIFGLTVSSSWGNGHATLWRGLLRALVELGHEVVFFERDVPYYAAHRDLTRLDGARLVIYPDWGEVLGLAREQLREADVAIVTSYAVDALAAIDLVLDSPARLRVFYDLDTPVTLARLERGEPVDYIPARGLAGFDLALSYTGGRALDELQRRLGARRVAPLYGSVDPAAHRRIEPRREYQSDFSYLGTYAADRQAKLEALFIEPARQLASKTFLVGGSLYPQAFGLPNLRHVEHVAPPDHPAFYSSSRLTLNITRAAMAEMGWCPSGRLFEAAACLTPVVSDWWAGLDEFFTPDSEIIIVDSPAEAMRAAELGDEEVARIARRAHERTLDEHTALHRAHELERLLDDALREMHPTCGE